MSKLTKNLGLYLRFTTLVLVSLILTAFIVSSQLVHITPHAETAPFDFASLFTEEAQLDAIYPPGDIKIAFERKAEAEEQARLEAERQRIREEKIQRVLTFLEKQRSKVANYEIASIIVDKSEANGADFRVVVAIMGIESGFCNASFWHNCFGYLNGVKYNSYVEAFNSLVPKVAKQYAAKYGWDFESLAKAYGMVNWEYHAKNMRRYANAI